MNQNNIFNLLFKRCFATAFILLLQACTEREATGNGVIRRETRQAQDFSAVSIEGPFEIAYSVGEPSLVVESDENLLPLIADKIVDNSLIIQAAKGFRATQGNKITIRSRKLLELKAKGKVSFNVTGVFGQKLALFGSGDVSARLVGTATELDVQTDGKARIDAEDMEADQVRITFAGDGEAVVNAKRKLTVSINGRGSVRYLGNPEVTKSMIGDGAVTPK